MTEYIPTTEEVYRAHWRGTPMRSEDGLREHIALDRWLAEVKAAQDKATTERIIELLQSNIEDDEDQYRLGWAIALIKGETE